MSRKAERSQLRLFGTVEDVELRLRNVLQRLPQGEYGMGQITPYLIRSCSPAEASAFAAAVQTLPRR